MAFKRAFAVLFVLATSVLASPHGDGDDGSKTDCPDNQFYYPLKKMCLPHGGVKHPPSPPPGKSCPPSSWYWNTEKSCCVPKHPPSPNSPPPQCKGSSTWSNGTQCCEAGTTTSTYPAHKPSETPRSGNYGSDSSPSTNGQKSHRGGKRHNKRSALPPCPQGSEACPVTSMGSGDYECLNTKAELRSCGGCASTGKGQDCQSIKGAKNVGCEVGSCAVYTCLLGYSVSQDGKSCHKN